MARFGILVSLLMMSCEQTSSRDWSEVKKWVRSEFPNVERVSTDELKRRLDEGEELVLLDVRQEEEYAVSHLLCAVRIEPGRVDSPELSALPKDAPIVAYCSVGYRSSALAKKLREKGFENVSNLEGSIFEWANKGYPVVRGGEAVKAVHPYDEEWGRLLDPSLRAYEPKPENP